MKKAWVLKREWKRKESGACLKMEQKNNTHPSLPSNYVTLAQLQERWLKQQNQIKQQAQQQQEEDDKEEQQKQHQQQQEEEKHVAVVAPTNVTVSRFNPAEQHRRKNRNDLGTNNRRADEVASENRRKSDARAGIGENRRKSEAGAAIGENRRKSEAGAGIGDEKADLDGKVGESKKKKKKWNKKWKGKMKPKVEERGTIEEEGTAAQGNEVAEKTTTESELNDEKNDNTTRVEEVEQKIGDLSINPGNGKQNWSFRRINNGFRQFQSQRNYRAGSKQQQLSRVRSIWVRKDGGVGEIEP